MDLTEVLSDQIWSDIISGTSSTNYIRAPENKFSMRSDILQPLTLRQSEGVFESSSVLQETLLDNVSRGRFRKQQKLFGFGENKDGQLGLGNEVRQLTPKEISFFKHHDIQKIVTGGDYTLVLTDKGLFGFGRNVFNQLGLLREDGEGNIDSLLEPTQIHFFDDHTIQIIATGDEYTLVLSHRGLFGFGYNEDGQLGLGDIESILTPTLIPFFNDKNILSVSTGSNHTLVLTNEGLFGFGNNQSGQLGLGDINNRFEPTLIPFFNTYDVQKIVTGVFHTLVLTRLGLFGFGNNQSGQLGIDVPDNICLYSSILIPTQIPFFVGHIIKKITASIAHTLVLTDKGLFSFGFNDDGQLGLGDIDNQRTPTQIHFFDDYNVKDITASYWHTLVLTHEGLFGFGDNRSGQLGLGDLERRMTPTQIPFFNPYDDKTVITGGSHTIVLTEE